MIAVADDQGTACSIIDRRATERELSILRKRLRTNVVPETSASRYRSQQGLLRGQARV
jgi:hypothetical protein